MNAGNLKLNDRLFHAAQVHSASLWSMESQAGCIPKFRCILRLPIFGGALAALRGFRTSVLLHLGSDLRREVRLWHDQLVTSQNRREFWLSSSAGCSTATGAGVARSWSRKMGNFLGSEGYCCCCFQGWNLENCRNHASNAINSVLHVHKHTPWPSRCIVRIHERY